MTDSQFIKVSVFRRQGQRIWYMQYRDHDTGNKVQRTTGTSRRCDAERAAGKWQDELLAGLDHRLGRFPWFDFRTRYEDEALSGLAPTTAKKTRSVMNSLERSIRLERLADLTEQSLSKYQTDLRDAGRSEDTIHGHLGHLKAMLNWAVEHKFINSAPSIRMPRRVKSKTRKGSARPMKGRPITLEELERVLAAVPAVVESLTVTDRVDVNAAIVSWQFYLRGLWCSGLRLAESLDLHWSDASKLCVIDLDEQHPLLSIPADLEKGFEDRQLPMAPEFATLLRGVDRRSGYVFNPMPLRPSVDRLGAQQVGKVVGRIGKAARVVVNPKTRKTASAHDLRRSFGDRWAQRVMPAVLMELMRHESIDTTMRYYVGRKAKSTAAILWQAAEAHAVGESLGVTPQLAKNKPR